MVNSLMYCSEQIAVPETFPNILKNYAKAAIRTQPYDLLRWSSAYFRCLAQDEPPPAKCRLEEEVQCGALTKGYLRVLLDQVGKGFFISREVLQKKWEGLCLPQDELIKYLSVSRMLNWDQVHWLKLFGVMVGSINETPRGTLTMLCELLTEDVEGGPARIPMWMFRTVYTIIAELDCSEEQLFVNGRKKLDNGQLEPERQMDATPKVLSTTSLKQNIMNECLARYNEEYQADRTSRLANLQIDKGDDSEKSIGTASSTGGSSIQFFGEPGNTKQIIQKCGDFDSLILLLREAQGAKLHEYTGPFSVTHSNVEHAKRREATVEAEREKQSMQQDENASEYLRIESMNMLREIGPPWSWIHQFASNNCVKVSFNFVEEGSIVSDVTPPESSDESFDFRTEKPIASEGSETDTHIFSTTTENPEDLIREEKSGLATEKTANGAVAPQKASNDLVIKDSPENIDLSDVSSIVSYLNKDEMGVLLRSGERATTNFTLEILDQILRSALQNGIVFESIDKVMEFVTDKYDNFIRDAKTEHFAATGYDKTFLTAGKVGLADGKSSVILKKESNVSSSSEESCEASENFERETLAANITPEKSDIAIADHQGHKDASTTFDDDVKTTLEDCNESELKKVRTINALENTVNVVENKFEPCSMDVDPKFLAKKISDTMVLGLTDKPVHEYTCAEERPSSTLDDTVNPGSIGGYVSDFSADAVTIPTGDERSARAGYICGVDVATTQTGEKRPDVECHVPPYPGIGRSVSQKTIHEFLTYLKFRSRSQKGMVYPRNFREDKCPKMFD